MRGRWPAPDAVVVGRPVLARPTGTVALEVVELLAEVLYREVTEPDEVTEPLRVSTVAGPSDTHPHENAREAHP